MNTIKKFSILFLLVSTSFSICQYLVPYPPPERLSVADQTQVTLDTTTLETPCPAPTGFQVSAAAPTKLTFTWNPSEGALNYRLRLTNPADPTFLIDTIVSAPPVTIGGLTPGTTYKATLNANCVGPHGTVLSKSVQIMAMTQNYIIVDVVEKPVIPFFCTDTLNNLLSPSTPSPNSDGYVYFPTVVGACALYRIDVVLPGLGHPHSISVFSFKRESATKIRIRNHTATSLNKCGQNLLTNPLVEGACGCGTDVLCVKLSNQTV